MSKHHACTEQCCKRVGNAFSCNVLANMSGTLLKDGDIVSHICTCNEGIAVALTASCIRTLRLEFANAVYTLPMPLTCKLPLQVLSLSLHYCKDVTTQAPSSNATCTVATYLSQYTFLVNHPQAGHSSGVAAETVIQQGRDKVCSYPGTTERHS